MNASVLADVCGAAAAASPASFLAMWMAMMVPMMAPSLAPSLWRYGQALSRTRSGPWAALVFAVGAGYFFVWALLGLAVRPLSELFARAGTPFLAGVVVLVAGMVQLSAWKRRQLAGCRACMEPCTPSPLRAPAAWLHGMHLGARCILSCGNLMAVVLVAGMADGWVMAAVTAAITLERVVRQGAAVARVTGMVLLGAALFLLCTR